MQKRRDRIEKLMYDHLAKTRMNDKVIGEASGPHLVPTPEGGLTNGWNLTVSLAHNKVLGDPPPIVSTVPIPGLDLSEDLIIQAVDFILDQARQARQRMEEPPPLPENGRVEIPTGPSQPLTDRPKSSRPRESHFPSKPGSEKNLTE